MCKQLHTDVRVRLQLKLCNILIKIKNSKYSHTITRIYRLTSCICLLAVFISILITKSSHYLLYSIKATSQYLVLRYDDRCYGRMFCYGIPPYYSLQSIEDFPKFTNLLTLKTEIAISYKNIRYSLKLEVFMYTSTSRFI